MNLLFSFAALSMCASAVMSLLPEGSLRKTAMLVMGVLMVAIWAEGISEALNYPYLHAAPSSLLTGVAFEPSLSAQETYARSSRINAPEDDQP